MSTYGYVHRIPEALGHLDLELVPRIELRSLVRAAACALTIPASLAAPSCFHYFVCTGSPQMNV